MTVGTRRGAPLVSLDERLAGRLPMEVGRACPAARCHRRGRPHPGPGLRVAGQRPGRRAIPSAGPAQERPVPPPRRPLRDADGGPRRPLRAHARPPAGPHRAPRLGVHRVRHPGRRRLCPRPLPRLPRGVPPPVLVQGALPVPPVPSAQGAGVGRVAGRRGGGRRPPPAVGVHPSQARPRLLPARPQPAGRASSHRLCRAPQLPPSRSRPRRRAPRDRSGYPDLEFRLELLAAPCRFAPTPSSPTRTTRRRRRSSAGWPTGSRPRWPTTLRPRPSSPPSTGAG